MSRSFTYIDDIVAGILGAVNNVKKYEIYNLGGGETVQLMDFIKEIEDNLKRKAIIKFLPMQAGDVKDTVASTKKDERDLGYKAETNIQDGIKKFIYWFLENQKWLLKYKEGRQ